jgi:hypothetical protein
MAIIQALIAALTRSAGKLLNTVFAWATVLLFGRVSEDRQIYLSGIAFGSVIWLVTLVGVAFPSVATFLLSFVTLPEWVDKKWIRLAMLAAVFVLPALIGVLSILMLDKPERPRGAGAVAKTVLKGYPYTVGLALTLVMMTVFAPVLKVRALVKRWTSEHVPVIIEPHDYREVVEATQRALAEAGVQTRRERASFMLRAPTRVLTAFAGGAVSGLVADEMTTLRSDDVEIVLHPSDIVINGREAKAAHTRAIIAKRLVFTPAHLTWHKEANELEDRLVAIWRARHARPTSILRRELEAIESELDRLEVPYEEWEVLFREVLLVERGLRKGHEASAAVGEWATTLGVGMAAVAPHAARVAESLESAAKDLHRTAARAPGTIATMSVAAAIVGSIGALLVWPWRRRVARNDVPSAEHSRRPAA